MSVLSLAAVSKSYGDTCAVNGVSHDFAPQCITALIGRSGCGKSTLLKLCNGLARPERGQVKLFNRPLDYDALPQVRRRIGYAVQGTGLFPHLSARDNITLLAQLEGWGESDVDERLRQLLALMQLDTALLAAYPHELSGGQQQRVGLCRAMMLRPELLLLDEPFAAIDPLTRHDIQQQLLKLQAAESVTAVLVTHDMREALMLAEHIVVMDRGQVVTAATREQLLQRYAALDPNDLLLALMAGELA